MSAPEPVGLGRRQLLRTGAAAFAGAGTGWTAAAAVRATEPASGSGAAQGGTPDAVSDVTSPPLGGLTVSFHGAHQAGVATPPQAHLSLVGLDLERSVRREGLVRLLRLLSDDAARLSRGLPALADTEPELAERPARLTVTFGLGPQISRSMFGGPGEVKPLPPFGTDRLDPAWGQTDLAVQICAEDPLTVAHARRMILKDSTGLARVRWIQEGFRRAHGSEPEGTTMRNVMGQVDGTVNPVQADLDFDDLIWSEEDGFAGGTFMVVRRIRALMDSWDRVDPIGREAAVGRTLKNGAPLTGTAESDEPDFDATDQFGLPVIDPASHIARARTSDPRERFHRRAYNYTVPDPSRPIGEDAGLVFIAFARDLDRQFVPVQRRLAELDRLNEWVHTIGSAVYSIPPGAADGDFVAQHLLDT